MVPPFCSFSSASWKFTLWGCRRTTTLCWWSTTGTSPTLLTGKGIFRTSLNPKIFEIIDLKYEQYGFAWDISDYYSKSGFQFIQRHSMVLCVVCIWLRKFVENTLLSSQLSNIVGNILCWSFLNFILIFVKIFLHNRLWSVVFSFLLSLWWIFCKPISQ